MKFIRVNYFLKIEVINSSIGEADAITRQINLNYLVLAALKVDTKICSKS